jgi:signal transduction histidine kinase
MLKHDADAFRLIRSKIGLKIAVLIIIQVIFIITSFSILSYYESQGTYLGNSINIAGKNRFLTSNLMLQTSEYFFEGSSSNDISKINSAIYQLETNILALREGGKVSDVDLKPLPSEFLDNWNTIYQKWVSLKTIITENIIKPNEKINPAATTAIDTDIKTTLEARTISLVDSSNALVTQLGEYARNSSQKLMFLQTIFAVLNIAVAAVVLYLVMRILKPIFALTTATSEISRGNFDVSVKSRGNNDELSVLSDSFNFMVNSIKNYVNKQNELTKKLKDANEELKYNDRLKDEFINVAAHELRSPIQPILGLSEFLRSNKGRENSSSNSAAMSLEKEEELLDVIVRNSKRLRQLAEDILDVAKIEGGSLFLKKEKFNIKEMITEILSEYEQKIKSIKNIKLSYDSQGNDSLTIEADKSRLCQVVYNLFSNAIKFTKDGSITVITEKKDKDDNFILVSIHDTGTGIDSEMLPKLFTKFATKSQTGGTGLGLFISKSIIERHGGKMWAENNSDGKGATFAFSLPIN